MMSGTVECPIEIESGSEEEQATRKRVRVNPDEPIVVPDESSGESSASSSNSGGGSKETQVRCSFCGELVLESRVMLHEKWCLSKSADRRVRVAEMVRKEDAAGKILAPVLDDDEDVVVHMPIGERLLAAAGYKQGRGMGRKEQGRKAPVAVEMYAHNKGLGYEQPKKLMFRKKRTR